MQYWHNPIITIELKNRTAASDNNDIYWVMLELKSVLVSDRVVIFFSSVIVLTPTGNIWIVPLLYSGMKCIVVATQNVLVLLRNFC